MWGPQRAQRQPNKATRPDHRAKVVAASSGGVVSRWPCFSPATTTTLLQCGCGQEMGSCHVPGRQRHGSIPNGGQALLSKLGEEKGAGEGVGSGEARRASSSELEVLALGWEPKQGARRAEQGTSGQHSGRDGAPEWENLARVQTFWPNSLRSTREEYTCVLPDYNLEIQKLSGSEQLASVPLRPSNSQFSTDSATQK